MPDAVTDTTEPARANRALALAVHHSAQDQPAAAIHALTEALEAGLLHQQLTYCAVAGQFDSLGRELMVAAPAADSVVQALRRSLAVTPGRSRFPISARPVAQDSLNAVFQSVIKSCLKSEDIHEAIDEATQAIANSGPEHVRWFLQLSSVFLERKDRLTAEHFATQAMAALPQQNQALASDVAQQLVKAGRADAAVQLAIQQALADSPFGHSLDAAAKATIANVFGKNYSAQNAQSQHGQALLLAYLREHLAAYQASIGERRPLLIEIGTTREEVKGQGSTRELAEFSKEHGIHFITVDMDPHNSRMAQELFVQLGCEFEAITSKGEDFLQDYSGPIDFVFLDAYDFDHGKHSELRQSRYRKFLGGSIDEQQCHQMHLDCAQSLVGKLAPHGAICFDDTWRDKDKWTAKGTLAMPYLLDNGFRVVEARNSAALLVREV